MSEPDAPDRVIALDDRQVDLAWRLTCALVANEDSSRKSLDQLFISAARFVEKVETGLAAGGVDLDSGKASPAGVPGSQPGNHRVTWRVVRRS